MPRLDRGISHGQICFAVGSEALPQPYPKRLIRSEKAL
jgi:hypothetical protein